MPRRPNPTVGMVSCAHCDETAAVRTGADGRYYYICMCLTQPAYAHDYVVKNGTLWGSEPAPEAAPDWIRRGLRFKPGARGTGDRPRGPAPQPPPAPAGEPDPEPAPALETPVTEPVLVADADSDRWTFGLFK